MRLAFEALLCTLFVGCASSYQVIDIIDLPPPQNVQAERHGDQIIIRWQPGRERRRPQFLGYKLYMATHSLATTPVQELPPPITLSNNDTTFALIAADTTKFFLHIRSYMGKRRISLPSLPEVIISGRLTR